MQDQKPHQNDRPAEIASRYAKELYIETVLSALDDRSEPEMNSALGNQLEQAIYNAVNASAPGLLAVLKTLIDAGQTDDDIEVALGAYDAPPLLTHSCMVAVSYMRRNQ